MRSGCVRATSPSILGQPLRREAELGLVRRGEPLVERIPAEVAELQVRQVAQHDQAMLEWQRLRREAQLHAAERRLLVEQVPAALARALAEHADHGELARREDRAHRDQRQALLATQEIEAANTTGISNNVRQRVLERRDHEIEPLVLVLGLLETAEPSLPMAREQRIAIGRNAHDHAEDRERDQQLDQREAPYLRMASHATSW